MPKIVDWNIDRTAKRTLATPPSRASVQKERKRKGNNSTHFEIRKRSDTEKCLRQENQDSGLSYSVTTTCRTCGIQGPDEDDVRWTTEKKAQYHAV